MLLPILLVSLSPASWSAGLLVSHLLLSWLPVYWSAGLLVFCLLVSQFGSLGLPVWSVSFDCAMAIGLSQDLRKRF